MTDPHAMPPGAAGGPAATPVNRVLVFAIVALALLMMSIDATIVATALHALQHGLHTSINWAGWTLTAYSFGFALMLPISGKLSVRYGRRRVFVASVLMFSVASALCGLASSIEALILLRVLQAAGGAGFTPSATGLIVDYFGDARDRAVSLFGSIFPIGAMIGPIFGGYFVAYWSWRAVFLVNVPIGLLITVLALRHIPPDPRRSPDAAAGLDTPGMLWFAVALLAAMFALNAPGEPGWTPASPVWLGALLAATLAGAAFVRHIRRVRQPFITPRLAYGRDFGSVNLANAIFGGVTLGAIALLPLYATNRYGIGALASGTLLMAQGLAAIAFAVIGALALRRTGYRLPIYCGICAIVLGLLLLAVPAPAAIPPYSWLAGGAFVLGVGTGIINPASRNAGLQLAPEQSSTLAALRTLSLQIGSIAMVASATAILAMSDDPGHTQAWVYGGVAVALLVAMPLVRWIPEQRGAW